MDTSVSAYEYMAKELQPKIMEMILMKIPTDPMFSFADGGIEVHFDAGGDFLQYWIPWKEFASNLIDAHNSKEADEILRHRQLARKFRQLAKALDDDALHHEKNNSSSEAGQEDVK